MCPIIFQPPLQTTWLFKYPLGKKTIVLLKPKPFKNINVRGFIEPWVSFPHHLEDFKLSDGCNDLKLLHGVVSIVDFLKVLKTIESTYSSYLFTLLGRRIGQLTVTKAET